MTVTCELFDYSDSHPLDNPKVIVKSTGTDTDLISIEFLGVSVMVSVGDIMKAVNACTYVP